jgi:hypothetical protein
MPAAANAPSGRIRSSVTVPTRSDPDESFVAFAIARRAPAEQRSGRPDGQRGAIAFGAKRSRAPLAQRDRWPSEAITSPGVSGRSDL